VAVRPRSTRGRGQHFLRSSKLAAELVGAARIQRDDLVLDLGAGTGVLTAALVRAGARVVAVEIEHELAEGLRRRFAGVDVRTADALCVSLPREPFKVVANLPFDSGTSILRRLLDPRLPLATADVVVQWALAEKRAAVWPSTQLGVYWGAWFELSVARRLPRCVFAPPPAVDAGLLRIVRRDEAFVPVAERRRYQTFLARGFREGPSAVVSRKLLKRCETELGFERRARPRDLDARQWAELYRHGLLRRPAP
jgi:16S rRNA A1518/A1519 N6-dimethyltransferase RsmA/KsgA/DIM1 with predicted DNA glycosylase/AP lyase activity